MTYNRYEYLSNPVILNYVSRLQVQTQWTQITVLNNQDLPLKTIQGHATGGSITLNSSSAVRRTGSLTLVVDSYNKDTRPLIADLDIMNEVTNIQSLISMNKRVQIEIGIENTGNDYVDFDIFWIPLGFFIISNASVSYTNSGIQVSLKLNDKMALLNGEEGGTFGHPLQLSPIELTDGSKEYAKIRDLIRKLVVDIGGLPAWQVEIDDIPHYIEQAITWTPSYYIQRTTASQQKETFDQQITTPYGVIASVERTTNEQGYYNSDVTIIVKSDINSSGYNSFVSALAAARNNEKTEFITLSEYYTHASYTYNKSQINDSWHITIDQSGVTFQVPEWNDGGPASVKQITLFVSAVINITPKPVVESIPLNFAYNENTKEYQIIKSNPTTTSNIIKYEDGQYIGYKLENFVYPTNKELSIQAGETIYSALEKIRNVLGNYEFFFDVDGMFHFQEIKNYLNEGSALDDWEDALSEKYFLKTREDKVVYSFEDAVLISSYSNNPSYTQIKNDFNVWGENSSGLPIRFHLLLDKFNEEEVCYWESDSFFYLLIRPLKIQLSNITTVTKKHIKPSNQKYIITEDWLSRLFFEVKIKQQKNQQLSLLEQEVLDCVPSSYELVHMGNGEYKMRIINQDVPYAIDRININDLDPEVLDISDFAISDIGQRTKVFSDKEIGTLFAFSPGDIPQILFIDSEGQDNLINTSLPSSYIITNIQTEELENTATITEVYKNKLGETITSPPSFTNNVSFYNKQQNNAYDALRMSIHEHLSYNNNISIQTMPVYHLDVNQRIEVENDESDIHGHYIIKSITIPLALNGMMSINAQKAIERI